VSDIGSITYEDAQNVTASNTAANIFAGFMVTAAGNVQIVTNVGTTIVIPCNANVIYPIATRQIMSSSTTATGIIGLVSARYNK
jgi:hypothetical protein